MATENSKLYIGPDAGTLKRADFGLMSACYDTASGRTHLLMEPSPEILDALTGSRLSLAQLLMQLEAKFDLSDAETDGTVSVAKILQARLNELAEAGLIIKVDATDA